MNLLLVYLLMSSVLVVSHGHYGLGPALGMLGAGLGLVGVNPRDRDTAERLAPALLLAVLVHAAFLTANTQMIYARQVDLGRWLRTWLHLLPLFAALALVVSGRITHKYGKWAALVLAAASFVAAMVSKGLVLKISPQPFIDVWTSSVAAVQHLLNGNNPYTQQYQDIYAGAYQYKPGMPYGPSFLLWSALWSKVTSSPDVRVGLWVAELLVSAFLGLFAWRATRSALLGFAAAVAWASNPIGLFVLEQSWIDSLLAAALLGSLFAAREKKWVPAGIALGFALSVKVYAIVGGGLLALWIIKRAGGFRASRPFLIATAASFAAWTLPFVIASPSAFWDSMIGLQVGQPPRGDALTLTAMRAELQGVTGGNEALEPLATPFSVLTLVLAAFASWWTWKRDPKLPAFAQGLAATHVWFFLFARQAFCNYYYYCLPFLIVALLPDEPAPGDPTPQSPPAPGSAASPVG